MKFDKVLLIATFAVGCADEPIEPELDEIENAVNAGEAHVPGQYIVVMREGASSSALAQRHGAMRGLELAAQRAFVAMGVGEGALAALRGDSDVVAVYPDAIAT